MGILSWIVLGLIVGVLAKWILPGKDPGGFVVTTLIGIAGAMLGGFIASLFGIGGTASFTFVGLAVSIGGALLLLFAYRLFKS